MASFLDAMTARWLQCWDKSSSSFSLWHPFSLTPAAISSLTASYKLSGTGTVLSFSLYVTWHKEALSPLSPCDKVAKRQCWWKNLPKVNTAWVTMALLGCLSQDFPISHPHYPLTNGSQDTDSEIWTTGKLILSSMSKSWKCIDKYTAFLMLKEANPNIKYFFNKTSRAEHQNTFRRK